MISILVMDDQSAALPQRQRKVDPDAGVDNSRPPGQDAAAMPNMAPTTTPRVTSDDWIGDFRDEPLVGVSFGSVFDDDGGGGADAVPLPLDAERFVPDDLFDFLKRIGRQGKGLDTLDTLAKKLVALGPEETPRRPTPRGAFATGDTDINPADVSPQTPTTPHGNLIAFLRGIEERYQVLTGENRPATRFAASSGAPAPGIALKPSPPEASNEDASVGAATPESTSSRSLAGGPPPFPLLVPGARGGGSGPRIYCQPNDADVLLGRGGLTNHHEGNKRYRSEIEQLKPWYNSCKTKTEKKELSQLFIEYVNSYGGRFLEKDDTGRWYLAEFKRARKKASQALRENKRQKRGL